MEVSITQFRRELFGLVKQALSGKDVWVVHKGLRLKLVPEIKAGSRLSRITPLQVISPKVRREFLKQGDRSLQQEMLRAWERDWSAL